MLKSLVSSKFVKLICLFCQHFIFYIWTHDCFFKEKTLVAFALTFFVKNIIAKGLFVLNFFSLKSEIVHKHILSQIVFLVCVCNLFFQYTSTLLFYITDFNQTEA